MIVVFVLIAIGSLYPFNFQWDAFGAAWTARFLATWNQPAGLGDLLGNILLFMPVGAIGMHRIAVRNGTVWHVVRLLILAAAIATLLQVLQVAVPRRSPSLTDVWLNILGVAAGLGLYAVVLRFDLRTIRSSVAMSGVIVAGLWLAATAMPLVPSIDLQSFKDSLKPLLLAPRFDLADFVSGVAAWLAVGVLLETPATRRWMPILLAAAGGVSVVLQVLAVGAVVTLAEVTAVVAAAGLWPLLLLLSEDVRREAVVAGLLIGWMVAALAPFAPAVPANDFNFVPFADYLSGSLAANTAGLMEAAFVFAAIFLLLHRNGARIAPVAMVVGVVVFVSEVLQVFIAGRSPGISDVLVVGLVAWSVPYLLHLDRPPRSSPAAGQAGRRRRDAPTGDDDRPTEESAQPSPLRAAAVAEARGWPYAVPVALLVAYTVGTIVAGKLVLSTPGIPYNVRELFRTDGSLLDFIAFSLFTLSFGAAAVVIGSASLRVRRLYIALPAFVMAATIISYGFLSAAVTQESIGDLGVSSNTYWFILNRGLWGDVGYALISIMDWPEVIAFIERMIRYMALIGPVFAWLVIFQATAMRLEAHPMRAPERRGVFAGICLGLHVLYLLPWLLLAKWIAFNRASTDNLNELIQDNGAPLYALLVLLAAVASVPELVRSFTRHAWTVFAVVVAVALPLSWLLLLGGLGAPVEKYGSIFRGVDFLLGPDRKTPLPEAVLIFRWALVYFGFLVAVRAGMGIARRMLPSVRGVEVRPGEPATAPGPAPRGLPQD